MPFRAILIAWICVCGLPATADNGSLFNLSGGPRAPLIRLSDPKPALAEGPAPASATPVDVSGPPKATLTGASLFAGRSGLLAPPPPRDIIRLGVGRAVAGILDLIASAEAGKKGYDAVQHGARIKPPKRPTQMTLAEIYKWIKDTPGQPHAIGRYQFIPSTLKRLALILNAPSTARFSPSLQDQLAERLLQEAGLGAYKGGEIKRVAFMNNLAKIWAGLPNESGRSHYHGYAGNKATMSWARYKREMERIFGRS